ncbi:MAG: hypothetical protein H3C47_14240 [Candidatus Cloacimonetes bacterium]|nr:hypothetical protein [Candidatus Cloacimonadota bacterium]
MVEFDGVNFGLFVLIWLVQVIIYPSFHKIDNSCFVDWHSQYTKSISFFVVPLMTAQIILAIMLGLKSGFNFWLNTQICLIAVIWLATFAGAVPCHKILFSGKDFAVINRLIRINWIRTILWTIVSLIDLF